MLFIGYTVTAQTLVKDDKVLTYSIDSVLLTGESVDIDFYGKDFFENNRVQVQGNAQNTGEDVVMTVIRKGSLDYANWTNIDTVSISGTSDNSAVSANASIYYDYVRYTVAVAGTTDTVEVSLNILFDVNQ